MPVYDLCLRYFGYNGIFLFWLDHVEMLKMGWLCHVSICILLCQPFFSFGQSTWKAPAEAKNLHNPVSKDDTAIKEGKKLYKMYCSVCHGDRGKGDGLAGVSLSPRPADFTQMIPLQSDGEIYWKMTEGRAPMAAYKDVLAKKQRWELVLYLRELIE